MPKTSRTPVAVAVVVLSLLAAAAPAVAATTSPQQQLQATRAKRAQLAAQLNAMKASDAQLSAAVDTLNREVTAQAASVDSARSALKAALDAADAADAKVAATRDEISRLRTAVVDRAVAAYTDSGNTLTELLSSQDLNVASQRGAFLDEINGRNEDALDQMRAALQDLASAQGVAARARDLASKRRRDAESYLAHLTDEMAAQHSLSAALAARIASEQQESDQMASQEATLVALIQGQESSFAASRGGAGSFNGRVSGAGLIWPCSGPITSPFGMRWGRMHQGIDIGCGEGTPIHAAKAGVVIFSGSMSGYGNVIIIDHGGGFSTLYAHQSRLGASQGEQVSQGQVIGYVGATGDATGPHLHFETRVNGTPENPMQFLP